MSSEVLLLYLYTISPTFEKYSISIIGYALGSLGKEPL